MIFPIFFQFPTTMYFKQTRIVSLVNVKLNYVKITDSIINNTKLVPIYQSLSDFEKYL